MGWYAARPARACMSNFFPAQEGMKGGCATRSHFSSSFVPAEGDSPNEKSPGGLSETSRGTVLHAYLPRTFRSYRGARRSGGRRLVFVTAMASRTVGRAAVSLARAQRVAMIQMCRDGGLAYHDSMLIVRVPRRNMTDHNLAFLDVGKVLTRPALVVNLIAVLVIFARVSSRHTETVIATGLRTVAELTIIAIRILGAPIDARIEHDAVDSRRTV